MRIARLEDRLMRNNLQLLAFVALLLSGVMNTNAVGQGLADLLEKEDTAAGQRPVAPAIENRAATGGKPTAAGPSITNEQKRKASARVRDVFAKDIAQARTPPQKALLGKAMIELVPETTEPAEALVLLEMGMSFAIDGNDPSTMDTAITLTKAMFGIALTEQRREALIAMSKKATLQELDGICDALVAESGRAADAGLIDAAKEAAKAAATSARRLRDPVRQKKMVELLDQLKEQEKAQAAIQPLLDRLAANPRDSEALLQLGRHRCFEEGNWKAGLELLAQGSDVELAAAARADLAVNGSPESHVKAGDLWFAVHEKQNEKGPSGPSERAKFHYESGLGEANGLTRAKILKRLDDFTKLEGGADTWVVIFRATDPSIWNTKTDEGFLRFAVPLSAVPPTVRFVRIRKPNGDGVVLPITKQQLGSDERGARYGWRGAGKKVLDDTFLGVWDISHKFSPETYGKVFIGSAEGLVCSGWGFGHKIKSGAKTSMAWNGETVPREPLEISVLCREMTAKERRQARILD
jgi:hypothetical protein